MSPLKEIKPINEEEASKVPWLHRARKKDLEKTGKSPIEELYDKVMPAITDSESGVVCLVFEDDPSDGYYRRGPVHEARITGDHLRTFAREKMGVNLEMRLEHPENKAEALLYIRKSEE